MRRPRSLSTGKLCFVLFAASLLGAQFVVHKSSAAAARCERAFLRNSGHLESFTLTEVSASTIRDYPLDEIATALVSRLVEKNKKIEKVGPNSFRPTSDTDLMIFFRPDSAKGIVKSGFLNIHQTGFTNGDSTPTARALLEDVLIGMRIEPGGYGSNVRQILLEEVESGKLSGAQIAARKRELNLQSAYNRLRPKSAYLVIRNRNVEIGNTVFRNQYGHYGAVLKDSVKPRSTWTPTDSLAASADSVFVFDDRPVSVRAHGDKDIKYYFEGQIWGPLDVSHVKFWIVPKGTNTRSEIYQILVGTGIPIREYDLVTDAHGKFETRRPVVLPRPTEDSKTR
jgi:hypothetical protein